MLIWKKKILFIDLDGTLLTDTKEITQENLRAIQKATELGHAIVVTTGRPLYSTVRQVEKLGLYQARLLRHHVQRRSDL